VLAATAQNKVARWSATLNLMELASIDGMEEVFLGYARELAVAPLSPWLRAHYLLFFGEGLQRFGKNNEARDALEEAVTYSDENQLHQLSFKAQSALTSQRSRTPGPSTTATPSFAASGVAGVVHAISDLRKTTLAAV
jgi:hypothetical protein